MVQIFDKHTGAELGSITDEQFQFMADRLEEESREDDDYYLNRTTVDFFQSEGADATLIEVLSRALGDRDEAEIRWTRS
ncbi:MAG TPA: galactosyldiacylglycerol synthase [Thermoanaerobaculia bacterium]|nr:galactosyldiacylglycerol synthase [Thermoanaerobaculia bacterium]